MLEWFDTTLAAKCYSTKIGKEERDARSQCARMMKAIRWPLKHINSLYPTGGNSSASKTGSKLQQYKQPSLT